MCYDCGCRRPADDHGDPRHITDKDFHEAAVASGESQEQAMRNAVELLQARLQEMK